MSILVVVQNCSVCFLFRDPDANVTLTGWLHKQVGHRMCIFFLSCFMVVDLGCV